MAERTGNTLRTFGLLALVGFGSISLEGCKQKTPEEIVIEQKKKEAEAIIKDETDKKNYSQKVAVRIYRTENEQKILDKDFTNEVTVILYRPIGSGREVIETALGRTLTGYASCSFSNRAGLTGTGFSVNVNDQPASCKRWGNPVEFAPWIGRVGKDGIEFEFYKSE